jgi:hypothetical protein
VRRTRSKTLEATQAAMMSPASTDQAPADSVPSVDVLLGACVRRSVYLTRSAEENKEKMRRVFEEALG